MAYIRKKFLDQIVISLFATDQNDRFGDSDVNSRANMVYIFKSSCASKDREDFMCFSIRNFLKYWLLYLKTDFIIITIIT